MATDLNVVAPTAEEVAGERSQRPRPLRRRLRRWLLVVAAVLAVGGVAAAAVASGGSARPADAVSVEGPAPAFDLVRVGVDAERVRLSDFAGRPLVVNFWASWCEPCRREMPALQAVAARLRGRVAFVGINHLDGREPAAEFEREVGVGYPSGYDPEGAVAALYGVIGLPTTMLVGADGRIVARRLGEISEDELLRLTVEAFGPAVVGGEAA